MKNRNKPETEQKGLVIVCGSFATNGASAIVAANNKGNGFSVARTGVGTAEVTFDEKYVDLVSFTATLQLATDADTELKAGTYTAPTSTAKGKIVVQTYDPNTGAGTGAAVELPAANANNRIHFAAFFRSTLVTK